MLEHLLRRAARSAPVLGTAALLMLLPAEPVAAAFPALGNVTGVSRDGNTVTVSVGTDKLLIRVCTPQVVRVDYLRNGQTDPPTPVVDLLRHWPGDPNAGVDTAGDPIVVQTSLLKVKVARSPCRLSLRDGADHPLLDEQAGGGAFVEDPGAPTDAHGGLRFNHAAGQHFYGIKAYNIEGSEKAAGSDSLLRDGKGVNNSTYQANAAPQGGAGAPFVWSPAGYGMLVDSDNGYVVVTDTRLEFYYGSPPQDANGRRYPRPNSLQYYLFVGRPKELLQAAALISGQTPMFPRWAMGFTNSQWKIDESELTQIVDTYRAKDIPLDNFTFDFDWKAWGQDNFGEFRWNTDNFPGAGKPDAGGSALKAKMDAQGVRLTGIMKPRIVRCTTPDHDDPLTAQAREAQTAGYWYPQVEKHIDYFSHLGVGELDFSNPACRQWYWGNVKKYGAMEKGIAGFWNDEADEADVGSGGHFTFNNFEHFHMQQALYEGQRPPGQAGAATPRVWSLNRNFYLGAQRYAYAMWSGDLHTGFDTMRRQTTRLLAAAALGESKWGMDTGGFFDDPSPENYARWVQFSAFVPVFRVHGDRGKHRQPWVYGSIAEEVSKNAIQLRYRLAPYVYACERSAYERAVGLVRPLMVEFPDDPGSADVTGQWMAGDWLLVAPVLRPQLNASPEQSTVQPVYLPPGTWVDYFRGDVWDGGRTISYAINPGVWSDIPLFVRQGAILPSQDVVRSLGEARPALVYLDVFPDTVETGTTFYDDDGRTYAYEGDAFLAQRMTARNEGDALSLTIAGRTGTYESSVKSFLARLHGRAGATVTLNGQPLTEVKGVDSLRAAAQGWTAGRDVYGDVTLIKLPAGQAAEQRLRVSGAAPVSQAGERWEAEDASLSGASPTTRARVGTGHAGFTGTGFVEGLDQVGAAVTFTVKARTAGNYPVTVRAANATGGSRTLSAYVNGVRRGSLSVPAQPDWDSWTDVAVTLPLAAGNNVITWRRDAQDTGAVNLDAMTVPFVPAASLYEAESAELSGGANVNMNHANFSGIGFVDRLEAPGAALRFTVSVPKDGTYTLTTHYANASGAGRSLSLLVNDAKTKAVALEQTADWDTWGNEVESVKLRAGLNTVTLKYDTTDTGHVNLDYVLLAP